MKIISFKSYLANLGENSKETALLIFNKESFLFKNEEFLDNLKKKSHFEQYFQVKPKKILM